MSSSRFLHPCALLALLVPAVAQADPIMAAGDGLRISYSADGLAFDPDLESGIEGYVGTTPDWYDFTYYESGSTTINPFLASSFSYELIGDLYEYAGYVQGTSPSSTSVDWTTESSTDLSDADTIGVEYEWEVGDLEVVKDETWEPDGQAVLIHFEVTNTSVGTIENFAYMHLIDPADTTGSLNSTNTRNDLLDVDGDGVQEYAQSLGRSTTSRSNNRTIGIGLCNPSSEEVNFKSGVEVLISEALDTGLDGDPDGSSSDQQVVYLHYEDSIAPGATLSFALILSVGSSSGEALDAFEDAQPGCWDLDGDGHTSTAYGGDDCDDSDDTVYGGADEIWYDGYDEDCAGDDDYDQDGDGYADATYADDYGPTKDPGTDEDIEGTGELDTTDCDDTDDGIYEGADEVWYDGYDEDCGGDDDYDQDGDGYADARYADDYGPTKNPGTDEDIEGTGELDTTDCDDEDDEIYEGADEIWYDGYDEDCGGDDDYDQDGDGFADASHADDYGPTKNPGTGRDIRGTGDLATTDCDDTDEDTNPDADEIWYDGIDEDCGEDDDYDQDADGYADADHADDYGPTRTGPDGADEVDGTGEEDTSDCDDTDAASNPDSEDDWYDGVDSDCAGNDDYDQDADGWADAGHADDYGPTYTGTDKEAEVSGTGELDPTDCDDTDPEVGPCATGDSWYYKGGGGCTCASGGEQSGAGIGLAGLLSVVLGAWTRRRRR